MQAEAAEKDKVRQEAEKHRAFLQVEAAMKEKERQEAAAEKETERQFELEREKTSLAAEKAKRDADQER